MSSLKVDNITGRGSTGFTGSVKSEGGNTTTDLQQGLCKAWINFTGLTKTAERDSFNIYGLTDDGTGKTDITITSNMGNANYAGSSYNNAHAGAAKTNFGNDFGGGFGNRATDSFGVTSYSSAYIDSYNNDVLILGDLA